ncbi:dihydroorotase [Methylonatrum kenyense]|uniref:dihydroorotase n=1 Tax=Methylonatrum kenyense TaxID=455253 RepID=UPI0020BE024F|nr:dihydroorotase [Methylonatrum kenyense]MCK8517327.1 dihydroorotase [Methylonatrum kenyense]
MDQLSITRPDDWHLHVRDGTVLSDVVPFTARRFGRAIIMPNLTPPVTDPEMAAAYRERILAAIPEGSGFRPLMTLYLTDNTPAEMIREAAADELITAVKLYPAGATTNSDAGVTNLDRCEDVLSEMEETELPLLVHGEVTHGPVDIFDRERRFIDERLMPLLQRHPGLRLVFEHITTADAVEFVRHAGPNVGATITPQHLLFNRNHMLVGGIRPHYYCLPILKRETDREALLDAATSGDRSFFLGTDSAPHAQGDKESACGCAGCFSAPAAIELYAEAFEAAGRLDRLEGFASHFGADFYRLPRNTDRITLRREPWRIPTDYSFGSARIVPLRAGETLQWQLDGEQEGAA